MENGASIYHIENGFSSFHPHNLLIWPSFKTNLHAQILKLEQAV